MAITWDTKPTTQPTTAPVVPNDGAILWNDTYSRPALDTTPAPEYKQIGTLKIDPKANAFSFGNPLDALKQGGTDVFSNAQTRRDKGMSNPENLIRTAGDLTGAGINVAVNAVPGGVALGNIFSSGIDKVGQFLGGLGYSLGQYEKVKEIVNANPQIAKTLEEGGERAAELGLSLGNIANILLLPKGAKDLSQQARDTYTKAMNTSPVAPLPSEVAKRNVAITESADQIYDIESGYAKLRDKNAYSKDGGEASRARIAESNVLVDTVNQDGRIDPMKIDEAVRKYQQQTIDGVEGVVRTELAKEKASININEVKAYLENAITKSRLAPGDLAAALRSGIRAELTGLLTKADEFGNILLEHIHDAKINTTSHIKYQTPAEKQTYMKAVASAYKKIVEAKSSTPVSDVNAELGKYYGDIERIRNLGGKTVKNGKIGKYAAQIAGNVAGGIAGQALGPLGVVGGSLIGGEVTAAIKGRQMSSTFGRDTGTRSPSSAVLDAARGRANLPAQRDLRTPDKKLGASNNIPKTREVRILERKISENVEAQKKAIKVRNFALVERLKEIYDHLVKLLKAEIARIKKESNRGFIALGTTKAVTPQGKGTRVKLPSKDTTTDVTDLQQILRGTKGMTADDIQKTYPNIKLTRDVQAKDVYGNKVVIPDGEKLTPYEMKDGKILLQDGQTYLVSKNQFANIKGNTIGGEAKPFAPELKGLEETVKGASKWQGNDLVDNGNTIATLSKNSDGTYSFTSDFSEGSDTFKTKAEAMKEAEMSTLGMYSEAGTKYSSYQLPEGKNYKEILIKAPTTPKKQFKGKTYDENGMEASPDFKSSHWDEPNVISHLRLNERTYKGKPVTFMEELQSDFAREFRKQTDANIAVIDGKWEGLLKQMSDDGILKVVC